MRPFIQKGNVKSVSFSTLITKQFCTFLQEIFILQSYTADIKFEQNIRDSENFNRLFKRQFLIYFWTWRRFLWKKNHELYLKLL